MRTRDLSTPSMLAIASRISSANKAHSSGFWLGTMRPHEPPADADLLKSVIGIDPSAQAKKRFPESGTIERKPLSVGLFSQVVIFKHIRKLSRDTLSDL